MEVKKTVFKLLGRGGGGRSGEGGAERRSGGSEGLKPLSHLPLMLGGCFCLSNRRDAHGIGCLPMTGVCRLGLCYSDEI